MYLPSKQLIIHGDIPSPVTGSELSSQAAQARASGFENSKPEPWAQQSPIKGLGLGWAL